MRKITTLLTLLLLCVVGAQADLRVDFGWEYGTYYKKGKQANYPGSQFDKTIAGAGSKYCNKWISADSYGTNLTVQYGDGGTGSGSTTENNFEMNTNAFCTGTSCHTVNISVADGYEITGYVIKGTAQSGSVTVTPAAGGDAVTFTTGTSATLTVSGLSTTSTSFVVSGDNQYVTPTEFYFTVKKLPQTIQWESYPGWVRNNVASVWWVGITTPGTTSNTYKMSDFQFCQETGYGAAERYACISKTGPTSAGAVLAESDVLGVSTNSVTATAQEYYTYQLADEIELTGGTTYYMVFLTSNTPTDGKYTVGTQRVSLNTSYGTYAAGTMSSDGSIKATWTPGFKATLTTDATYTVNYTCKSTVDNSDITSGSITGVVGAITAPDVNGYVFDHATTSGGDAYVMTSEVTENLNLIFYYNPIYDVTYNVYIDGTLKGSETVQALHGSAPVLPASLQKDFLTYGAFSVAEITSTTTEVNVDATWNGPFEYGSTLATSHWYFLTFRPDAQVCYPDYETTGDYNVQAPATRDNSDKFKWAFVGDPINGFTIYNKAAGDGLVLGSATHDPSVDSGNSTKVTMGTPNSQTEELWTVQASSYATDGFFIVNSHDQGLNKRSNSYIAYWTNGKDIGSTFVVTDAENFYDQVMAEIKPVYDNAGKPFYTSLASVAPMQTLIEQVVNTSFCSQSDYETLQQYVQDAATTGYVYPESGNYRFKNTNRGRNSYIAYGTAVLAVSPYENRGNGLVAIDESGMKADLSTVFTLTKTAENNYKISTVGQFVKAPSANNYPFRLDEESAAVTYKFTILNPGVVAIGPADVTESSAQKYFHEGDGGTWGDVHCVVQWTATSAASSWSVEEADDITVAMNPADDGKAYATFYAPFDAEFTNVTAYTITKGAAIDGVGSEAVLTAVSGAVPAGTPVVLVGENGTLTTATADVSYGATALNIVNILSGHYLESTVEEGSLVLGQSNGVPGFYKYESYATKLGANRAFIAPENASNIRALVFVDPTTGISTTTLNTENGNAYDLQGRRVQNTQKGLYIINGKKVLVK